MLMICAAALTTAACNTISGVGRDVSSAGNAVSKAADRSK
ncbi:entericidin A/B family lipoprotein [Sphingomonas sp. XMGL2]|uniref:Entericidin A/B family lipoprotein n=1 Tax=Sphingomonas quercus TaxID=2842451 RepID=A0ABS6BHL6_9SPHN|nr:entericidin A/B family lipoprotein [Sphingomonas quercus]MBU3076956.1 entericidin A/B family lipoprotein [Sphingomonas quercus]